MDIKPSKGYRPLPELAPKVALLPNNLLNEPDRKRAARTNPYSFAHVVKPRINFPDDVAKTDQQLFDFARDYFEKMIDEGVLIRDITPCLYIYRMIMDERVQTGLICCMNIHDYDEGHIKKHEHTRPEKELENVIHIENTKLNSNPVFLAYRPVTEIDELVDKLTIQKPDYDFISETGVRQNLWIIKDKATIEKFVALFDKKVSAAYIADGHHRAVAASQYAKKVKEQHPDPVAPRDYNYFLTCLLPSNQLRIFDYNRIVKSMAGLDEKTLVKKISEKFFVELAVRNPYGPSKPHRFGMFVNGKWYKLKAKPETFAGDPISSLDVSILQDNILEPIFGIKDPRTDKNIDFIPGVKGLRELERRVLKGKASVAFSLFPVSMEELISVSDAGEVMPPKSTWFEPKLMSGLVVFRMEF